MKVRPAKPNDAESAAEWAAVGFERNLFDPDILSYPQTTVFCAETDAGELVSFLPAQLVVMLESVASDPNAGDSMRGRALYFLFKHMQRIANVLHVRELYFVGTDEKLNVLAERCGFEKLEFPVYRFKLRKTNESNH